MTLPNYILRRHSRARGIRLEKLPLLQRVAGTCAVCSKQVLWKKIAGVDQLDGRWVRGEYYHWLCATPDEETEAYAVTQGWMSRRTRTQEGVAAGNLPQDEYRYWIGTDLNSAHSGWAMCRCCRKSYYSKADRIAHFKDPDFMVNGEQCSGRLVKAYARMSDLTLCIVCRENRHGYSKWGVPICNKASCERAWKFGQDNWIHLASELNRQKKIAEYRDRQAAGKIVKALIDNGGEKATIRPYCTDCNMFTDNAAHEDEHRARIIRGEISAD